RGDNALDRIIEKDRTGPDADVKLEGMSVCEVWFELANRLSFVVKDGPAAANPTRVDFVRRHLRLAICSDNDLSVCIAFGCWARFGLDFLLNLSTKPIG